MEHDAELHRISTISYRDTGGFRAALERYILPAVRNFDPEVILISAGFDGHKADPLGGGLGLRTEDFAWATQCV